MTTQAIAARRYSRRCRQRRRAKTLRRLKTGIAVTTLVIAAICCLSGGVKKAEAPGVAVAPVVTVKPTTPEPTPAPRWRDDIVTDGQLLSHDLQVHMQDMCEKYGVPYALALAMADVESRFDPDAASRTNDYGLMQINKGNHDWLRGLGMDPMTHEGNIEAGVYMIGQHLETYGDTEKALMAYNNGPSGARRLWEAGTYQTDYTRKVMAALEKWTSVLEVE